MEIISFQKRKLKKCSIEGCSNFSRAKGLCNGHYAQFFRHGEIQSKKLNHRFKSYLVCKVKNCGFQHYAKGYCLWHYNFFRRTLHWHKCSINGCDNITVKKYCKEHQLRLRHHYPLDLKIDCRKIRMKGSSNPNFTGKNFEYPNHSLMKKNRLIILARYPMCQKCDNRPSREVHHRNENKSDHRLVNLMAVCRSCNAKIRFAPNVKYHKIYGMTLKEIADNLGGTEGYYRELHRKNKLYDILEDKSLFSKEFDILKER